MIFYVHKNLHPIVRPRRKANRIYVVTIFQSVLVAAGNNIDWVWLKIRVENELAQS